MILFFILIFIIKFIFIIISYKQLDKNMKEFTVQKLKIDNFSSFHERCRQEVIKKLMEFPFLQESLIIEDYTLLNEVLYKNGFIILSNIFNSNTNKYIIDKSSNYYIERTTMAIEGNENSLFPVVVLDTTLLVITNVIIEKL